VIAAIGTLRHGQASELRAEQDDGVVQQAALAKISVQSRGLVDGAAAFDESGVKVGGVIPCALADLDEASTGFTWKH
jgi:hypothetical protein